jgi:hypothetical protein
VPDVRPRHSAVEIGLNTYAVLVFAMLWIGLAVGLADGGRLLTDAWARLTGLEVVAQVALWILFLPIAVLLWAWNAGLAAPFAWVVALGLITWTLIALAGLARAVRGHPA